MNVTQDKRSDKDQTKKKFLVNI